MPKLTTEETKIGIAAGVASGLTQMQVAKSLGVSQTTVAKYWHYAKSALPALADNWRENQAQLAVHRVNKLLADPKSDDVKAATVAQTALKGLGYYAQEAGVKLEAHFHSAGAKEILALDLAGKCAEPEAGPLDGQSGQDISHPTKL